MVTSIQSMTRLDSRHARRGVGAVDLWLPSKMRNAFDAFFPDVQGPAEGGTARYCTVPHSQRMPRGKEMALVNLPTSPATAMAVAGDVGRLGSAVRLSRVPVGANGRTREPDSGCSDRHIRPPKPR